MNKRQARTPVGVAAHLVLILGTLTAHFWLIRVTYIALVVGACLELNSFARVEQLGEELLSFGRDEPKLVRKDEGPSALVPVTVMLAVSVMVAVMLPNLLLLAILLAALLSDVVGYTFDSMVGYEEPERIPRGETEQDRKRREAFGYRRTEKSAMAYQVSTVVVMFVMVTMTMLMLLNPELNVMLPPGLAAGLVLAGLCMSGTDVKVADDLTRRLLKEEGVSSSGVGLTMNSMWAPLELYLIQHRLGGCLQMVDAPALIMSLFGGFYITWTLLFH